MFYLTIQIKDFNEKQLQNPRFLSMVAVSEPRVGYMPGPKREVVRLKNPKENLQAWQESITEYFNEKGAIHLLYRLGNVRAKLKDSKDAVIIDLTKELGKNAKEGKEKKGNLRAGRSESSDDEGSTHESTDEEEDRTGGGVETRAKKEDKENEQNTHPDTEPKESKGAIE